MTAPALALDDVSHAFGTRPALDRFTMTVYPGRVTALIGLNGAGKTTALRALAGRLRPAVGRASVLGHDAAALPGDVAARFGQVVDTPLVYPELTASENLVCAARLHGLPPRAAAEAARDAGTLLGLAPWRHVQAGTLSLGNRQRLGIACAVVHRPAALVLDEPTNALDPRGIVLLRNLVRDLARHGTAVLVSSHHLDEVARVADEIVVLHAGRDIGRLDPAGTDLEQRFFAMVLAADADTDSDDRTHDDTARDRLHAPAAGADDDAGSPGATAPGDST